MSRLLGIVNPSADPADEHNYWIWHARRDIPAAAEWDYERLSVYSTPAPDGNVCVWVTGPPTEKQRDGVFLKMLVGAHLNPTPRTTDGLSVKEQLSWETALEDRTILTPLADMR